IGTLSATVPTDVALYLLNQQRDELNALERRYDVRIAVLPRPDHPKERCDLEFTPRTGPAPAVTREAQKRRLDAREEARGAAPVRVPAVREVPSAPAQASEPIAPPAEPEPAEE